MPWYVAVFWILAIILIPAALAWGGWPERVFAIANLAGTVATRLAQPHVAQFKHLEAGLLMIDLIVAAVYLWVALRSDRWWPILATALLGPSLLAHLAKLVNPAFLADGYSIAGLTAYLIPPVIAFGIWCHHRRALST